MKRDERTNGTFHPESVKQRAGPKGHGSLGVFEQLLADIVEAHSLFQEQPLTSAACGKLYVCLLPFVEMNFDPAHCQLRYQRLLEWDIKPDVLTIQCQRITRDANRRHSSDKGCDSKTLHFLHAFHNTVLPFYPFRATIYLALISHGFRRWLACVWSYRRHSYSMRDGSG